MTTELDDEMVSDEFMDRVTSDVGVVVTPASYTTPVKFAQSVEIDYVQIKNDLDALESNFREGLREILAQSRDSLLATIRKRSSDLDAMAMELKLPYAGTIQRVIRDALQRALDRGKADADGEVEPKLSHGKPYRQEYYEGDHYAQFAAVPTFVPKDAIKWLKFKSFWVSGVLNTGLTEDIRLAIINGLKTGKTTDALVTAVAAAYVPYLGDPTAVADGELPSAARLETIVRTNTTEAYNQGRLAKFATPETRAFLDGLRYSAVLDSRTTEVCRFLHDKVFKPDDASVAGLIPPNHFNCRSIIVPVVVGEEVDPEDFITDDEILYAQSLADVKFLEQAEEFADWNEADHPRGKTTDRSSGGSFAPKDRSDVKEGDPEKFAELKNKWASVNNDLLQYVDTPEAPEVQKKMDEMKALVLEMAQLHVDPGGLEGIGKPGGLRDVVIIGAGPGGLSASVMAGTDGLDTLLIEAQPNIGGQAKYSSRIENYPGFPVGVSGTKLANTMFDQTTRLGAELKAGKVVGLEYDAATGIKTIRLESGEVIESRSVVLAGGLEFQKMKFPGADSEDVIYGDGQKIKVKYAGKPVVIVGGSNGAAQAALGAALTAEHVYLISRSPIEKSMSDYQVKAINQHAKIEVIVGDAIQQAFLNEHGKIKYVKTMNGKTIVANAVGIFIGGPPRTDWLPPQIVRDSSRKIQTDPYLETGIPGVFAVGDLRAGSIGRVGSAVGDGQMAEKGVFSYFEKLKTSGVKAFANKDRTALIKIVEDLFDLDRDFPMPQSQYIENEETVPDFDEFKFDPSQARAPKGTEEGGQWMDQSGYSRVGDQWVNEKNEPLPAALQARMKDLKVPPAWTHVRLNPDLEGDLLVKGVDAKGRSQYLYSKEHSERMTAEKFERLKAFNTAMPSVQARSLADMQNPRLSLHERDTAAVVYLISRTGFRIGGEGDTGAKVQAYGASTLLSKHIKVDGDEIKFSYIAKKGVRIKHSLEDKPLADYLKGKSEGKLFDTNSALTRTYFKTLAGDKFKVKDMRTWKGTSVALQQVAKMPIPKNPTAFKKARTAVAKVVAAVLGNTPSVALKAYIDNAVFAKWEMAHDRAGANGPVF